jgi:hypothetical protein
MMMDTENLVPVSNSAPDSGFSAFDHVGSLIRALEP